jgi:hypothetical protein
MKLRFPIVIVAAIFTGPAWAQSAQQWMSPPDDVAPVEHGGPTYSLDTLFSALKIAPDDTSAKAIEDHLVDLARLRQRHLRSVDEPGEGRDRR